MTGSAEKKQDSWRVLHAKDEKTSYVISDVSKDFHTKQGYFKSGDLQKLSGDIETSKGKKFSIFPAVHSDRLLKMARHAQIIREKDVGVIISYTSMTKDSVVVDSGAGSGALACRLGFLVKKVITHDIDDRSIEATEKNIKLLGLKNITVKKKDAYEGFSVKNADVVTLDLPEPWRAIDSAYDALVPGGHLVSYNPNITQSQQMVNSAGGKFIHLRTVELIEREWMLDERRCRPDFAGLGHTGFLSFFRKV